MKKNKNNSLKKIAKNKVSDFRYKKIGRKYLLTNLYGAYIFLTEKEFNIFLEGALSEKDTIYWELQRLGFIKDNIDFENIIEKCRVKNKSLNQGPSLHIMVVTLRCNHNCVYCHASAQNANKSEYDMSKNTAKKSIDLIFDGPSKNIAIEFQGGEPMLNWEIIQYTVEYSKKKAKKNDINLELRLISNLSLMTDEKLKYCYDNEIGISTSLDGPEFLHNKNRTLTRGNSHKKTVEWFKKATKLYKVSRDEVENFLPGAILTVSKESLKYPKEIVDEYISHGINTIFIRHLNPYGFAENAKEKIYYTADDYIKFYLKALDYIIELNKKGIEMKEMMASFMLMKILLNEDPNYLELRSPCGAGIGQIAYNYNGDVYTCDEGRLLSEMGDDSFKIGNVFENKYEDLVDNDVVKSVCSASCLDAIPHCSDCVFNPYCGVCPIYNYSVQGNLFGQMPSNDRCKINMAIFEHLFKRMEDEEVKAIFYNWVISDYSV